MIYMYTHTHVHTLTHTLIYTHTYPHSYTCALACMHAYSCTYVRMTHAQTSSADLRCDRTDTSTLADLCKPAYTHTHTYYLWAWKSQPTHPPILVPWEWGQTTTDSCSLVVACF
eukprot:GHVU01212397.1.p1 GENE.GHVU01212397.1~~GHVU01212397.1.p1  ORF type:complete len:114 (-),score=3.02 GHVU01212397.1:134-475(-)